ncbi:hypothetical protein [Halomonas sp. GFAJ-1]|uniref:hypothetical protein n=1 Tax=Halomonas sp. GFAJ-1 TaxID=1118153 RepID=UPI00023A41CE|nr:hypothetical protein [Halomonas sp. GFAJ-1]AVI62910.1 hypothetical protein BB497_09480 [Halomonas sp. GFAJ-1]EHK62031.1 hypothetical protein MOY_03398 [Halomonas sp. GFAJ-1]
MHPLRSIEKLLPFITAATPGGFRIFVLGFASFFVVQDSVVFFSTQYTLASFFVMVSGVGFATILMKRMANDERFSIFFRYALSCSLIGGGVAACVLFVISLAVPVPNLWAVLGLTLITSLYQVFRNYLVFKRHFWKLFFYDFIIGLLFLIFTLAAFLTLGPLDAGKLLNVLTVSYALAFLIVWGIVAAQESGGAFTAGVKLIPLRDLLSSLVVGFSNAASSGVGFILPSLFIALGGNDVAIVASLCVAVFSAMSALPRGLINNNAFALSKMVMLRDYASTVVVPLRKKIYTLVAVLVPTLSITIVMYFYISNAVTDYWIVLFFVAAFAFNVATGQLGVIESVLINFCGYERFSLTFNMVVFSLVLLVFGIVRSIPEAQEWVYIIYAVPFALGVINILRLFWYRKMVIRYFEVAT